MRWEEIRMEEGGEEDRAERKESEERRLKKRKEPLPPKQGGPLTSIFPLTPLPTRSISSSTKWI